MSELLKGMSLPAPSAPAKPKDAAAVVLFRPTERFAEVFWLKREPKLQFAGGFYAFPGGKVDASDSSVLVEGASGVEAALRVTAARELFEETGVLAAEGPAVAQEQLDALRKRLLSGEVTFEQVLAQTGRKLVAAMFIDAGRWITPPHLPVRFDARFFLVEMPADAKAEVWPGELTEGEWVSPNAALNRWSAGTALLHPPNVHALQTMVSHRKDIANTAKQLQSPTMVTDFIARRIEFQMGIRIFPVRSATLPPATHTNCYVLGNSELLIVDPGAIDDAETDRLLAFIRELKEEYFKPTAVVLTHHHFDHLSGAARVMSELKIPLWCHERTEQMTSFKAERHLVDGELVEHAGMKLRVLHTPGHASGHICLVHEASMAALVGDMVAGVGTIVVDPPDGNMAEYLRQLERLKAFGVRTLYPAHGPPIPDGPQKLHEYLEHRAQRESKVVSILTSSPRSLQALVPLAYDDVPPEIRPVAERNLCAILLKLESEGRVRKTADELFHL